jgi:hypothetical protein
MMAALAVVGGLAGIGSTARGGSVLLTWSGPSPGVAELAVDTLLYLGVAMALVVGMVLVYVLWPQRRRKPDWEPVVEPLPTPWWVRLLALVPLAALVAGLVALLHGAPGRPRGAPSGGAVASPAALPANGPAGTAGTGEVALVAAAIVLAAALASLAVWWLIRHRQTPARPPLESAIAQAIEEGMETLTAESDPRRAVVRAYAVMERALARRGWPRRPWEAPLEYLERVLFSAPIGPREASELTQLFEVARFSEHTIDEAIRQRALDALLAIRGQLEGVAAA